MNWPAKVLFGFATSLPGVLLAVFALPHLSNSFAVNAAIPVPSDMIQQRVMPVAAYLSAHRALEGASVFDGDAQIADGETQAHFSSPLSSRRASLERGVRAQPASARGWTLLSEAALAANDQKRAATYLSQALILGPYDYWLAGPRAVDAAQLWPALDADTRAAAALQVQILWGEPALRPWLHSVLSAPYGVTVVAEAFAERPDDLRLLNRWLSAERRRRADAP